jgi:CDP-glycerol glycerophosphotransferase (TagB/SpsB family)
MIRRLLTGFPQLQVWFKPHPASGVVRPSMLAAIAEIEALLTGGEHVIVDRSPALTLTDCLARADVLLSDISSVVSDFLATGRPVIVTNPGGLSREDYRAAYPSQRGSYVVDPDLADFDVAVTDALGPDPLRPEREALVGYLLGTVQPQAAFDAALARLAQ